MEHSKADAVRKLHEREDEELINLLISDEEHINPNFCPSDFVCPKCQSDTLEITEIAEGDSERVYFQMKCPACGCEFVILEDLIDSCRRGIENAKAEIKYSENKISYFENKLKR